MQTNKTLCINSAPTVYWNTVMCTCTQYNLKCTVYCSFTFTHYSASVHCTALYCIGAVVFFTFYQIYKSDTRLTSLSRDTFCL